MAKKLPAEKVAPEEEAKVEEEVKEVELYLGDGPREMNNLPGQYHSYETYWLVVKPHDNGCHTVLRSETCREYTIGEYASRLVAGEQVAIAMLLCHQSMSKDKREERIFTCLESVHMFEEHLEWPDKTELVPLKTGNKNASVFLIRPNYEWFRAPHTMSMLLLFLRSGYLLVNKGMKCPCCIPDVLKTLQNTGDIAYVTKYHERFLLFLRNLDTVYEGRTRAQNFSKSTLSNPDGYSIGKEGIGLLFGGTSKDRKAQERMNGLVAAE